MRKPYNSFLPQDEFFLDQQQQAQLPSGLRLNRNDNEGIKSRNFAQTNKKFPNLRSIPALQSVGATSVKDTAFLNEILIDEGGQYVGKEKI